jgi:anti-sigma B factor antagonist
VLTVSGSVDFAVDGLFAEAVADAVATAQSPLVVDLREVVFMDSSGISRLVQAYKTMLARGDYFGVVAGGLVLRLLRTSGLLAILNVREDLETSIAEAGGAASPDSPD